MKPKAKRHTDHDSMEDDGFTYWVSLPSAPPRPKRDRPELNATTIGWRRFWDGDVVCETLRLPKGYIWTRTGSEEFSGDMRDYTRRGLTDPDPSFPDVLEYTTAFTMSGDLTMYFIKEQRTGAIRIERVDER